MPDEVHIDIDEIDDWLMAEVIINNKDHFDN